MYVLLDSALVRGPLMLSALSLVLPLGGCGEDNASSESMSSRSRPGAEQALRLPGVAREHPDPVPRLAEPGGRVPADESRGAGDEDVHPWTFAITRSAKLRSAPSF